MRGKERLSCLKDGRKRITPAYAGKSRWGRSSSGSSRDHPRVCGEKNLLQVLRHAAQGSPPRMRGKACPPKIKKMFIGITPAYAGKRPGRYAKKQDRQDHPRVCGEKTIPHRSASHLLGSPPRMRGKDSGTCCRLSGLGITPAYAGKSGLALCPLCCGGITPAYAGKSSGIVAFLGQRRDHPRICGEKPLSCLVVPS